MVIFKQTARRMSESRRVTEPPHHAEELQDHQVSDNEQASDDGNPWDRKESRFSQQAGFKKVAKHHLPKPDLKRKRPRSLQTDPPSPEVRLSQQPQWTPDQSPSLQLDRELQLSHTPSSNNIAQPDQYGKRKHLTLGDKDQLRLSSPLFMPEGPPATSDPTQPENSQASEAIATPKLGIEFDIYSRRVPTDLAYIVKHQDETLGDHGTRWRQSAKKATIVNRGGKIFKSGDIVRISFDIPPSGHGKIIEIREGSEPLAVVQWLYTKTGAKKSGLKAAAVKLWPGGVYMLSNHFQIVPGGNVERLSNVKLNETSYLDARVHKTLGPLSELERRLATQMTGTK